MTNKNSGAASTIVAVVVALAVAGTGGYMIGSRMGEKRASLNTDSVATFSGGGSVTKLELYERMVKQVGAQASGLLIDEKLINQAADKAGVTLTAADYDGEIARLKDQLGGDAALTAALKKEVMTLEELKTMVAPQLKALKMLSKDVQAKDEDVKKYFDENVATYDKAKQVHAQHILVATEPEAKALKAELDKGTDFATLAKQKSTDPSAKENSGDLGTFGRGKMAAEFDQVVFNLKAGETSQPFQTSFGWHIAKVLEVKDVVTFESVKNKVKDDYVRSQASQKLDPWIKDLRDKASVKNSLEKPTPTP